MTISNETPEAGFLNVISFIYFFKWKYHDCEKYTTCRSGIYIDVYNLYPSHSQCEYANLIAGIKLMRQKWCFQNVWTLCEPFLFILSCKINVWSSQWWFLNSPNQYLLEFMAESSVIFTLWPYTYTYRIRICKHCIKFMKIACVCDCVALEKFNFLCILQFPMDYCILYLPIFRRLSPLFSRTQIQTPIPNRYTRTSVK